jgi:hypothetical protein
VKGTLLELGPDTVSILTKDSSTPQTFALDSVGTIERAGDPVGNGALIGATIFGVWCAIICGQGTASGGKLPLVVLGNGLIGGLIGAGIDAAHSSHEVVYQNPNVSTSQQTDAFARRLGVTATIRW